MSDRTESLPTSEYRRLFLAHPEVATTDDERDVIEMRLGVSMRPLMLTETAEVMGEGWTRVEVRRTEMPVISRLRKIAGFDR